MKLIIAIIFTFFLLADSNAQKNFIPKKYQPIAEVVGDLDKDGINEKVVVYNISDEEDDVNGTDREIIIFKKSKGQWNIWHRSLKAVMNSKDGGMMGNPFEGIEIKGGVLLIYQSGGSSWKWSEIDRYRYQNKTFELIGNTANYGKLCEYWTNVDFNITTGRIIIKKEYEDCDKNQAIYKRENETFIYKLKQKITLFNRNRQAIKLTSPKYKHEIYL
jgi:hypothetical protein